MTVATKLDLSNLPAGVRYVTRDQWGLDEAERKRRNLSLQPNLLDELYWHHTGGMAPDLTSPVWDDDPIRYIQWLDELSRNGGLPHRYSAVAYSWMIHKAPGNKVTVIEARGDIFPAATKSRNTTSKAVCFVGNFSTVSGPRPVRSPRQSELDAGRWLRTELVRAGVLSSAHKARGHHQNPSCPGCSTCPGNLMTPHLPYLNTDWPAPEPDPDPDPNTGVLQEMYIIKYRKQGWPGEAVFRVTADGVDHAQNADAVGVDEEAGVPVVDATKAKLLAVLRDKGRTHRGTGNPFVGDYADTELNAAW